VPFYVFANFIRYHLRIVVCLLYKFLNESMREKNRNDIELVYKYRYNSKQFGQFGQDIKCLHILLPSIPHCITAYIILNV